MEENSQGNVFRPALLVVDLQEDFCPPVCRHLSLLPSKNMKAHALMFHFIFASDAGCMPSIGCDATSFFSQLSSQRRPPDDTYRDVPGSSRTGASQYPGDEIS